MKSSLGKASMACTACTGTLYISPLIHRQLEESYLNQYTDSEEEASDIEGIDEGVENCDLSGGEEVFDDELYCVACNKFFNSESAKLNHEASKKHKQNTELLKSEMKAEEENYQEKLSNEVEEPNAEDHSENEDDEIEAAPSKKLRGKKSKKKGKKVIDYQGLEPEPEQEHANDVIVQEIPIIEPRPVESDEDDWSNSKKIRKLKTKAKSRNEKVKLPEPEPKEEILVESETKPSQNPHDTDSAEHRCATCRETFQSKNKLFAHLKKTNHSIYLGDTKAKANGEKPNSRKNK